MQTIGKDQFLQEELQYDYDSNISTINQHQLKKQNAFYNLIVISLITSQQKINDQSIQEIMLEAQKLSNNRYLLIEATIDYTKKNYYILLFDHHNNINNVIKGMQILVYGGFNNENTIYFSQRIKNDNFYVLEPKTFVSATQLSNLKYCRRKQLVKEFFKNQVFGTNLNKLRGNMLHYLFQNVIEFINDYQEYFQYVDDTKELDMSKIPSQFYLIFKQLQSLFLKELYYIQDYSNKELETSILQGFFSTLYWIKKYIINHQTIIIEQTVEQRTLKISFIKWVGNEKKIASSVLGLVGVIDVIIEVQVIINNAQKKVCKIPIEIKSGIKQISDKKQVQTYLLLMNHHFEQETLLGMILYLNQLDHKIITYNQDIQKDLLFFRNLYVSELKKSEGDYNLLPKLELEIKKEVEQSKCFKCGIKNVCYGLNVLNNQSKFQFQILQYEYIEKQINEQIRKYLNDMLKNLRSEKQAQIISKIQFEIKQKQNLSKTFDIHYILSSKNTFYENEARQILKEFFPTNRELTLFCNRTQKTYQFSLKKQPNIIQKYLLNHTSTEEIDLEDGLQYLIRLHVQDNTELSSFGNTLEIEDVLTQQIQQQNPYKYYNFIIFELVTNKKWSRKKELLILGYIPQFKSKSHLYEGSNNSVSFFLDDCKSHLNKNQYEAIQLCLLAEDFVLIQGNYGKRRMLSHLLFILRYTNKKILFCSADDEILDEQINDFIETFPNESEWILRLQSKKDQDSENYQKYSFDFKKYKDISEINKQLENKYFYFTTCQYCTDLLYSEVFDYCIVDQSTKIIEPSCISCILKSKVFILLQDSELEQPFVKSQNAELLKISLYQRLSQQFKNIGCLVDLDLDLEWNNNQFL